MKKEALGISKEFYTVKETTQKSHYVPNGCGIDEWGDDNGGHGTVGLDGKNSSLPQKEQTTVFPTLFNAFQNNWKLLHVQKRKAQPKSCLSHGG